MRSSHQLVTAISFGLTSGVITALGLIIGLYSATSSRTAVLSGIIVIAIADGLADAAGLHISEEAETEKGEVKHTSKETWMTTVFTFLSVGGIIMTFSIPIILQPLETAMITLIIWGILLLILLNLFIARITDQNPIKLIAEHLLLALFVIYVSHIVGNQVSIWVG